MSPRILPFSHMIEQERRRWVPFRSALSTKDQEACDWMLVDTTQRLQAEVQRGRPWTCEVVLMAVFLAHEKRLDQVRMRLEAVNVEKHVPGGNPPT